MNEHQYDYNSDFQNTDYASEQHLSPDLTGDYSQNALTDPTHTEQPWEQLDQTDYTQPEFNAAEDYYSSGYDAMEMQSNSYGSDLSDFNSSHDTIQYDSVSYEQSTYSVAQTSFDNALDTQDYNNNLWEQQYQEQSVSSYDSVSVAEPSYGHDLAAENVQLENQNQPTHFTVDTHPGSHLREGFDSGYVGFTPTSPSNIDTYKEVTFKDSSGHEYKGTVMHVSLSGDKYDIQDSEGNTHRDVPFHNIEKYRSK